MSLSVSNLSKSAPTATRASYNALNDHSEQAPKASSSKIQKKTDDALVAKEYVNFEGQITPGVSSRAESKSNLLKQKSTSHAVLSGKKHCNS